jgi:hypothetical protein
MAAAPGAVSGHAAAAPSSVMNWRRLGSSMGSSPEPAVPAYSRLRMPRKRPQVLGLDLNHPESGRPRLPFAPPHRATPSWSKGRLIRCTVPGLTPNCLAMTRIPALPGVARASRIRFSRAGAIGGRPRRLPSSLARATPARSRSAIIARSRGKHARGEYLGAVKQAAGSHLCAPLASNNPKPIVIDIMQPFAA